MQQVQISFLFNTETYTFHDINFQVLGSINNTISTSLFLNHEYRIQSDVTSEVFQSFVNYLFQPNAAVPNITPENIEQYYLLNQEFQSAAITNLIDTQRATFNEYEVNLTNLRNPQIRDKTRIEQSVAENLDEYVTNHGEEFISLPINSLLRILRNDSLSFTQYDRLYELIVSEYQRTHNSNIFTLLPILKLDQLQPENQRDAIEQQEARFELIPKPDLLTMIDTIDEQRRELNQLRENYQKIARMFIRSNVFSPVYSEGNENRLLEAFEQGDTNRATSILTVEYPEGHFRYRLNLLDLTATITYSHNETGIITVPTSVRCNDCEFVVTSIARGAFDDVRNLIFPENSQVRFMEDHAAYSYDLESIQLPPLLENFSALSVEPNLRFDCIHLHPNSRTLSILNDEMLLGKSNINSNTFDVLLFAKESIREANIPEYITKINKNAFANCYSLTRVNFPENSQLKIIDDEAFQHVHIENITIPSQVTQIGRLAFGGCVNLSRIDFFNNSQLQIIAENAFAGTSIESITIPFHVRQINSHAFGDCKHLKVVRFEPNSELRLFDTDAFVGTSIEALTIPENIEIFKQGWNNGLKNTYHISLSPNSRNLQLYNEKILLGKTELNSDNFDIILFACRDVEEVNIPDFVKYIGPSSFAYCKRLREVHFSENSQLSAILENAFRNISLQSITIPSHVQQIDKYAFANCQSLSTVDFAPNSILRTFSGDLFTSSSIQNLTIPSSVCALEPGWYNGLNSSCNISLSPENNNFHLMNEKIILGKSDLNSDNFDILLFARRDLYEENIPDFIRCIGPYAFANCGLRTIHFSDNSQLAAIEKYAFSKSSLREIIIPQHVRSICDDAFHSCKSLTSFQFAQGSELQVIGSAAFMSSSLSSISIPPSVTQIKSNAFSDCSLQSIVFDENSQLREVGDHLFYSTTVRNATIPPHLVNIIRLNQ